jgi:hypothetical protein
MFSFFLARLHSGSIKLKQKTQHQGEGKKYKIVLIFGETITTIPFANCFLSRKNQHTLATLLHRLVNF